jgi:hypothetical protein
MIYIHREGQTHVTQSAREGIAMAWTKLVARTYGC